MPADLVLTDKDTLLHDMKNLTAELFKKIVPIGIPGSYANRVLCSIPDVLKAPCMPQLMGCLPTQRRAKEVKILNIFTFEIY